MQRREEEADRHSFVFTYQTIFILSQGLSRFWSSYSLPSSTGWNGKWASGRVVVSCPPQQEVRLKKKQSWNLYGQQISSNYNYRKYFFFLSLLLCLLCSNTWTLQHTSHLSNDLLKKLLVRVFTGQKSLQQVLKKGRVDPHHGTAKTVLIRQTTDATNLRKHSVFKWISHYQSAL